MKYAIGRRLIAFTLKSLLMRHCPQSVWMLDSGQTKEPVTTLRLRFLQSCKARKYSSLVPLVLAEKLPILKKY